MQDKATLNPTPDQTFEIVGQGAYDFVRVLTHSKQLQRQGRVEEACNERFHAFQRISELLPEDEEVILEWEDPNTRAALEVIHASAIDHFLINDFEMSTAMLELLFGAAAVFPRAMRSVSGPDSHPILPNLPPTNILPTGSTWRISRASALRCRPRLVSCGSALKISGRFFPILLRRFEGSPSRFSPGRSCRQGRMCRLSCKLL